MNLLIGICLVFWGILNIWGVKKVVYEFTDILSDRADGYINTHARVLGVFVMLLVLTVSWAALGFSIALSRAGVCPLEYLR